MEGPPPANEGDSEAREIRKARLEKIDAIRSSNSNPFSYTFDVSSSAASLASAFEGKLEPGEEDESFKVSIAGRVMARRVFGKLAFFSLQDESGQIQLQFDKKKVRMLRIIVVFALWHLRC